MGAWSEKHEVFNEGDSAYYNLGSDVYSITVTSVGLSMIAGRNSRGETLYFTLRKDPAKMVWILKGQDFGQLYHGVVADFHWVFDHASR